MAGGIEVQGAEDIDRLVKSIRTHADSRALRRDLFQGLNREAKSVGAEMRGVVPRAVPRRGGFAARLQAGLAMETKQAGQWTGVRMRFRSTTYDIRVLNGSPLRHPVFGNRRAWITQTAGLSPEVFTDTFQQQKPEMVRAVHRVLEDVARKVTS